MTTPSLTARMARLHTCVQWGDVPNKIHAIAPGTLQTQCGLTIPTNVERGWYSDRAVLATAHGCAKCRTAQSGRSRSPVVDDDSRSFGPSGRPAGWAD